MKIFTAILLFFGLVNAAAAQSVLSISGIVTKKTDTSSQIKNLTANGISLNNGWKFHAGDDKEWAKPGFNDDKWQPVDPLMDVQDLTPLRNTGIGWFRKKFKIDTSLRHVQFALTDYQCGATEIYINGKLIKKFGTIGNGSGETVAVVAWQPFKIPLKTGQEQAIAIRFGYESDIPYFRLAGNNFILYPNLNTFPNALINRTADAAQSEKLNNLYLFIAGAFGLIVFLQLAVYLFYRKQKANLYYAVFSLVHCYVALVYTSHPYYISTVMYFRLFGFVGYIISMLFLDLTIYSLFQYKSRKAFRVFVVLGFVTVLLMFIQNTRVETFVLNLIQLFWPLLGYLEALRVSILSIRKNQKGAKAIASGIILFFILFSCTFFFGPFSFYRLLFTALYYISFPIGMAVFFGIQAAITNRTLEQKLIENQLLSEQTIAAEQEKQHLLSSQNEMLETKVTERTNELSLSLQNLKAVQNQLIQSAKMASLGELTSGIAHEIQNPLNFVNNFSEVSIELLQELKEEEEAGNREDVIAIANDLTLNLQKINHHGKRADSIVKGMLEHSRTSQGEKILTNINTLAEEFLNLCYHGFCAKDKNFAAELVSHFEEGLPKLEVAQQDIGRVLLNLFNNAFYAVNQKKKTAEAGYRPTVELTTFAPPSGGWGVKVRDNGNGIPEAIKDKIMQPFFTTKPTGEGTGLGLSLSYDIIVKGHGGTINVDTREGEFTAFIVSIPKK